MALAQIAPAVAAAIARHGAERVAVVLGTSTSGIGESEQALRTHAEQGQWRPGSITPSRKWVLPRSSCASAAALTGPAWTLSTACSSSAKALMSAARMLRAGIVDAVIAGGADSLCRFTVAGFSALESVSALRCNPFSQHRAGINIGEVPRCSCSPANPARYAWPAGANRPTRTICPPPIRRAWVPSMPCSRRCSAPLGGR